MRRFLPILLALPLSLPLAGAPVPPEGPVPDWKAAVRSRAFEFDPEKAGAVNSTAALRRAGVAAEFNPPSPGNLSGEFVFSRGDGPKIRVRGHNESVFVTRGDVLYFADYHRISSGCRVAAYDLTTGKKGWEKELTGLGPIMHSKYRNRVAMAVEKHPTDDRCALVVTGWESAGEYIEVLDLYTGRQLAHKTFTSDETRW